MLPVEGKVKTTCLRFPPGAQLPAIGVGPEEATATWVTSAKSWLPSYTLIVLMIREMPESVSLLELWQT
ncbi:hypothetical protein YIM730264_21300 [Thermus hydrothermalis]